MKNGIEEAGMTFLEIPKVDWAAGLVPYENSKDLNDWQDETWNKTLVFIKENRKDIDVFISYLYPKQIDTNAINEIKKLGIPCVNFYCDNVREFTSVPKEFNVFDLIWVPEFEAISMYKTAKIKYVNLPMPIWIDPKYRLITNGNNNNISFIGTKDFLRNDLLAYAIKAGVPIDIFGNGWIKENNYNKPIETINHSYRKKIFNQIDFIKKFGIRGFLVKNLQKFESKDQHIISENNLNNVLSFDEYIAKTKESSITLGINRVPSYKKLNKHPLTYSRLRDLEAPMLSSCYLTEYTEGLEHLYELGSEIETYKNEKELVIKCHELMNNPEKRKMLRRNGQKRALNEHSIKQTLFKIKNILF